jgi:hypothetical protein
MFIATLFTIAKKWKQPKYLPIDRQRKDEENVVHIHNGILFNHIKDEILSFVRKCVWNWRSLY